MQNSFMRGPRRRAVRRPRTARGRRGALDTCGASVCKTLAIRLLGCLGSTGLVLVRDDRGPWLRRLQLRIDRVLGLFCCGTTVRLQLCTESKFTAHHTTLSRSRENKMSRATSSAIHGDEDVELMEIQNTEGLSWAAARDRLAREGPNKPTKPCDCPAVVCCLLPCLSSLPSMRAYARCVTEDACVRRDGAWNDVDAIDVVRGDLVLVQEGELAPADLRLVTCTDDFLVSLIRLNGVDAPVSLKVGDALPLGGECLRGNGKGIAIAIGDNTNLARRIRSGRWPPL